MEEKIGKSGVHHKKTTKEGKGKSKKKKKDLEQ